MHGLEQSPDSRMEYAPDRPVAIGPRFRPDYRLVRTLLIIHVIALVLVRLIPGADDFSDWDLIPFLNANAFHSLSQLLARPELHFYVPFSFSMNVGAESVPSAVLLRALGHVSLFWSNVLVLIVYDAIFFLLVGRLFAVVFANPFSQCLAWALLAMSPIILTYAATSAFNMQAYLVVVLGLLGCEYFLRRRPVVGALLLAAAFGLMPQGYPLGLFLPYYAICWVSFRAVLGHARLGAGTAESGSLRVRSVAACLVVVIGCTMLVQRWSHSTYVATISPVAPYGPYGSVPPGQWTKLGGRTVLFLRQAFVPIDKVDGVPVGFAPYFVYAALLIVAALVLLHKRFGRREFGMPVHRPRGTMRTVLGLAAGIGTITFGYLPAFLAEIVKSQRAVFGDLFLIMMVAHWIDAMRSRHLLRAGTIVTVFTLLLMSSDLYYLHFTVSVDHSKNHSPVFDFDKSDGVARHDLAMAIHVMREQVVNENTALVIYYPDTYNENHTDPAVFFARFLRHFGRYRRRPELIFPCRWCEVKYGCPFPEVRARGCSGTCCYNDPLFEIRRQRRAGKRVLLWWWREPKEVRDQGRWVRNGDDLAADWPRRLLRRLRRRYEMKKITLPHGIKSAPESKVAPRLFQSGWLCYELVETRIPAPGPDGPEERSLRKQPP